MTNLAATMRRYTNRAIAHLVAGVLRPGAVYDSANFRLWESRGYHVTPLHFYSPIPDTRELERRQFQPSSCPGIDLRPDFQLELLEESFVKFQQEYNAFPTRPTKSSVFYLDNDAFCGTDPYAYYCMIRHFKPRNVVEVGSGYSTLLGAQASQLNECTSYVCIDPWPRDFISTGVPGIEFIRHKVEDLDLDIFLRLRENDILFVDGSHVVRTAGDVCFLMLEVLPRLAPGVIIHFHDIFLPSDYPRHWVVEEQRFWTEQYLLHAYLADNSQIEVLFASHFLAQEYPDRVQRTFPNALSVGGGSFWIRRC